MIPLKEILCLLPLVVVIASQDQYVTCALVDDLVHAGEVTNASFILLGNILLFYNL